MTYLGIDLGTSGVKALLIDDSQQIIASADGPLSVSRPHSGWSEQKPADWITATKTALESLKASYAAELAAVRGIGLSGQMHGATLLGKDNEVLRPCMLWNDTRSHAEAARLDADPQFRSISGNIVFPGFTAPKVEWVRTHEAETFSKLKMVLLPKDYLRLWLTGEAVSEMSDASGTSWLNVAERDWSDTLLEACQLDRSVMPSLVEGNAPSGDLRDELVREWGMFANVVVAGGAGDNAASAVGMGTVNPDDAFVSLGTSGVVFAATDSYRPRAESAVHAFCHALPGMWHQMGVILSATDALNWYAGMVGEDPRSLADQLPETLQKPSGITFLPYLSGERTPHNDAAIRGAFMGLEHASTRGDVTRAVMEGVAFALRDNLEALKQAGTNLHDITAVGGGSRSRYWLQLIATVLELSVRVPKDGDFGAAFGAARLGMMAASQADWQEVCLPPETDITIEPDRKLTGEYVQAHDRFTKFYEQIKGL